MKCRGCGSNTDDGYEGGPGPMHYLCEIKRLDGLYDESKSMHDYAEAELREARTRIAALVGERDGADKRIAYSLGVLRRVRVSGHSADAIDDVIEVLDTPTQPDTEGE